MIFAPAGIPESDIPPINANGSSNEISPSP
jgi:hypothetical protein